MSSESEDSGLAALNRLLDLKYHADCASSEDGEMARAAYQREIEEICAKNPKYTRHDIEAAIRNSYRDYCRKLRPGAKT